jgi:hypothetical protein
MMQHHFALVILLRLALASHCWIKLRRMMMVAILVMTGQWSQAILRSISQTRMMGGRSSNNIRRQGRKYKGNVTSIAVVAIMVMMTTTINTATTVKAHDLQSGAGRLPLIAIHPQSGTASVAFKGRMVNLTTPLVLPLPRSNPPTSETLNWLISLWMLTRNGKSAASLAGKRLMVSCNTGWSGSQLGCPNLN